jgi:hypothetical protein
MEIPRLISVDDHVIEPAHVWQENLPAIGYRDSGPVLVRRRGRSVFAGQDVGTRRGRVGPMGG